VRVDFSEEVPRLLAQASSLNQTCLDLSEELEQATAGGDSDAADSGEWFPLSALCACTLPDAEAEEGTNPVSSGSDLLVMTEASCSVGKGVQVLGETALRQAITATDGLEWDDTSKHTHARARAHAHTHTRDAF